MGERHYLFLEHKHMKGLCQAMQLIQPQPPLQQKMIIGKIKKGVSAWIAKKLHILTDEKANSNNHM